MEVRLLSLPVREPLAAAHDSAPPANRELVVVKVTHESGVTGWGEGSALNRPTYTAEFARQSFETLAGADGAPELSPRGTPMAWAAVANACDDICWQRWRPPALQGGHGGLGSTVRVPAGAALGLAPLDVLEARAAALAAAGFQRIKVKIDPAHHRETVAAVRSAAPGVALHVDANGAMGEGELGVLVELVEMGVEAIEQPFAPDAVQLACALVARVDVPVVADEAVSSVADARRLLGQGALTAVAIKGPRVGGYRAAVQLADWCLEHGVGATAGGMLESGLGRAWMARLAGHAAFTIPGDVSPANRWLAGDPWPDLVQEGGDIVVESGNRLAPAPNNELLERFTLDRAEVVGPAFLGASSD